MQLTLSLPNVAKGKFLPNSKFHFLKNFEKQIVSCESTGRELSFEWSHHRISSTDSKVRVTLQNSIKHYGGERVKGYFFCVKQQVWCVFSVFCVAPFCDCTRPQHQETFQLKTALSQIPQYNDLKMKKHFRNLRFVLCS